MRRSGSNGFSLVELLVVMAVFGSLTLAGATLLHQSQRAAGEAGRLTRAREERWEAVRLLRRDVANARAARLVSGSGPDAGLELIVAEGRIWWTSADGELRRSSAFSPPLRPLALRADLRIEQDAGREFVRYLFEDELGSVEGRVLLGGSP